MRKFLAGIVSLTLLVSMVFVAAPTAYGLGFSSLGADQTVNQEASVMSSDKIAEEAVLSPVESEDVTNGSPPQELASPLDETLYPSTAPSLSDEVCKSSTAEGALSNTSAAVVHEPPSSQQTLALDSLNPEEASSIEKTKALAELKQALNNLYETICSASEPSIVRMDSGYLTKEAPRVHFQEGVCSLELVALMDEINSLLEICGLSPGFSSCAFPLSVVGIVPEGFIFEKDTLTLTNTDLLFWNEELDNKDALTRSYELTLQLNTGIGYIDAWLQKEGIDSLATASFVIELQLISDAEVVDPDKEAPGSDPKPAGNNETMSKDASGQNIAALDSSTKFLVNTAFAKETSPVVSANASDDDTLLGENMTSQHITIEDHATPMASKMFDEDGGTLAVNGVLVMLSLIMSVASILSLRSPKQGSAQAQGSSSASSLNSIRMGLGVLGVSSGALSVVLLVISHYLIDGALSATIAWTPVLITLSIVQATCLLGLLVSNRIIKKERAHRYKIRY